MKKFFTKALITLAACTALLAVTGCDKECINHDYTEYGVCTLCGHYEGLTFQKNNHPKTDWELGTRIVLEFSPSSDARIRFNTNASAAYGGYSNIQNFKDFCANFQLFDSQGNEYRVIDPIDRNVTEGVLESYEVLKANQKYYFCFDYVSEPKAKNLFPEGDERGDSVQIIVDRINNDPDSIYCYPYVINE